MKRYMRTIIGTGFLAASFAASSTNATDLMQVYRQALRSDPIFAQAESTWQSQKLNLPIAQAGYLPQVTIGANASRNYDLSKPALNSFQASSWQYGYNLALTQPIFDFVAWAQIKGASASVKSAAATYIAAQQSLMQRTAQAYFAVLQAYDTLRYTVANRKAVWQQFETAREQFRVGLIAITDEYDARSRYDQVVAQQIAAQNNLNIQLENLRAITGQFYGSLKSVKDNLQLAKPNPYNVDQWVTVASKQNYSLISQNYSVIAAMENIKQQEAGGYPTLDLQGSTSDSHTIDNPGSTAEDQQSLGLALTYKPIQGGLVIASSKQARYNYVTAAGLLEQTHRQVVNQTRSSFLGVLSNISRVKADRQSIVSANNALEATEAGLKVGTRTMVDVLSALTALYQAQQQHANDQYAYINNLIALKAAAGTLSVGDLAAINAWLGKSIRFPEQTSVSQLPSEPAAGSSMPSDNDNRTQHQPADQKPVIEKQLQQKTIQKEKEKTEKTTKKTEKKTEVPKKEIKTESQKTEPKKVEHSAVESKNKRAADAVIHLYAPLPAPTMTPLPAPKS